MGLLIYGAYFFLFTILQAEGDLQFPQKYDIVIKYAQILDGSGEKEVFRGDLGIKDGVLVQVGAIEVEDCPVFDAGGLTVMPWVPEFESSDNILEHHFYSAYPRYPATALYFSQPPYQGLSLAQLAHQKGLSVEQTFRDLQQELSAGDKVYLLPEVLPTDPTLEELAASLTGALAKALGKEKQGQIKPGYPADLYFFITHHYDNANLEELFLRGKLPDCALCCLQGELLSADEV